MELNNSTFIVTGGASGLGAACVRRFAAAGANIVAADINDEWGNQLADEFDNVIFAHTDVTNQENVNATVQTALENFESINGLVNCAGIAIAEKVLSSRGNHDLKRWQKVIEVNLIGSFSMTMAVADTMSKQEPNDAGERGVIISTASVAAFDGQIGQSAYAASKGGIVGMTLPIARELARFGIRNVTIAPGLFYTPMMSGLPEKAQESLAQQVPFPSRLGRPDEYAQLAQQIVENQMLNGEVIRLDGAIRLAPR